MAAVLGIPAIAGAQGSEARVRIGVNYGIQTSGDSVSQNFTVQKNVEPATITSEMPLDQAPVFDIGGWVKLAGRLGVGVSFSRLTRSADATINASIPHPFYFNQPRAISGTQPGLHEEENAVHLDVVGLAAATERIELTVFGGVTFFSAKQDVVTDVQYTESYPFDTATFTGATLSRQSASETGYNVGADVTWSFSERVGVGGLIRFSRASADYAVASTNTVSADLGGLQALGGIRFRF
ncbi:MAG TPA: hypothetical protein VH417_04855 [Vicinamibacterales bacterium]